MCVAIFKPRNSVLPDRQTLQRCFDRNPDGAGFALYRNNKIEIHKGFMDFDSFYFDLLNVKPELDENILIHFRIATHGLVDGGNTHPFPITSNFDDMRKIEFSFYGKVFVHNGIFHYSKDFMHKYDPKALYSDTMIFSMLLAESLQNVYYSKLINNYNNLGLEDSIAFSLIHNNHSDEINSYISSKLSYSKVAIMDENGEVYKYGNWIEHNGCFFSNNSFQEYKILTYGKNYIPASFGSCYSSYLDYDDDDSSTFVESYKKYRTTNSYKICDFCGAYKNNCIESDGEYICKDCLTDFNMQYCYHCKTAYDKTEMHSKYLCDYCYDMLKSTNSIEQISNYEDDDYEDDDNEEDDDDNQFDDDYKICLCCGQNMKIEEASEEDEDVCAKCYAKYKSGESLI